MTATLTQLRLLDVVALTEALPDYNLVPGQVGTIVETLAHSVYEVEFSDDDGQTYATLPLKSRPAHSAPLQPVQQPHAQKSSIHQP